MIMYTLADGRRAPAAVVEHRKALLAQFGDAERAPIVAIQGRDHRPMERADIMLAEVEVDRLNAETRASRARHAARRQAPVVARTAAQPRTAAAPALTRHERSEQVKARARAALYVSRKETEFAERKRINARHLRRMTRVAG